MSLGNTLGSDAAIYDECIEKGYALLGYGGAVEFTDCTSRSDVLKRCIDNGLQIENPQTDYTVTSVAVFVTRMKPGDLLVISDGNFKFRAIGEVDGEYKFQPHSDYPDSYAQMRPVKWLRVYEPSLPHGELMNSQFSQMTLYELRSPSIDLEKLQRLLNSQPMAVVDAGSLRLGPVGSSDYKVTQVTGELVELSKPNGNKLYFAQSMLRVLTDGVRSGAMSIQDIRDKQAVTRLPGKGLEPYVVNGYANILAPLIEQMLGEAAPTFDDGAMAATSDARVLIIDEINRGNISRIFGELITLIEPSKRAGAAEALEVLLPYSKKPFSVPQNVYLIGTMNTADRSLTGMDVALRRRFVFNSMPPRTDLLEGLEVEGIFVEKLLSVINQRIEALLDRDHCLGHAYFIPLLQGPTLDMLAEIFSNQVIPLLQEYFFDDWQRIQWVLNDHRKPKMFQFVSAQGVDVDELFGPNVNVVHSPQVWSVNDEAFFYVESYLGVINHLESQDEE
ncbi:AAA family ATPase [Achromobacter xylosoxidans]|nr:AAA family ATPase [Achromobacter xylosoxidans]